MSYSYSEEDRDSPCYEGTRFGYMKPISIECSVNKRELDILMNVILAECKLLAFGYDKAHDEYWAKISETTSFFIKTKNEKIEIYPIAEQWYSFQKTLKKIKEYLVLCEVIPPM